MSSVAVNAFFTTPKSFSQHTSSCRTVAIGILLVRLRCSEQRITGVVNKLLPRSRRSFSLYGIFFLLLPQKAAMRSQLTLSLSHRAEEGGSLLLLPVTLQPSRERIPSPNAKIVIIGISEGTSACTAMLRVLRVEEGIRCDDRSWKNQERILRALWERSVLSAPQC